MGVHSVLCFVCVCVSEGVGVFSVNEGVGHLPSGRIFLGKTTTCVSMPRV